MSSEGKGFELDVLLKKAELEKIKAERDEMKFKASRIYRRNELIKGYGAIASALAGLAAIGTLIWTVWQGINQIELQREERSDVRVEKAIRDLNSENSKLRLFSVSALRILLSNGTTHRDPEILSAISYALATEKEVIVRDSMISLLSSLDYSEKSSEDMKSMLIELVGLSRSLVLTEQLWTNHEQYFSRLRDESSESRAQSLAEAINILIKNKIRVSDLSGIYCAYCDFKNLDLNGLDFSESILHGADFTKSNLVKSVFNHAVLERTKFVNANLKSSSFTDDRRYDKWAGSFEHRRLDKSGGSYGGPDFSCADLSDSNFTEFPIFILSSDAYDSLPFMNKIPPQFIKANLSGADFSNANVLIYATDDLPELTEFMAGTEGGFGHVSRPLRSVEFNENTRLNEEYYSDFSLALAGIKVAFFESSWKKAKLPKGVSLILNDLELKDDIPEMMPNSEMKQALGITCSPL